MRSNALLFALFLSRTWAWTSPSTRSIRQRVHRVKPEGLCSSVTSNPGTTSLVDSQSTPAQPVDAVVCGAGPSGLLTAIMLAQKLPLSASPGGKIRVYDRLSEPPNPDDDEIWTGGSGSSSNVAKFYLIGLGGRGQTALSEFGAWDGVVKDRCVTVVGRRDYQPGDLEGTERIFTSAEKRVATEVLPRDKLVGALHQHIVENYADRIELNYGYEVHPLDFDHENGSSVLLEVVPCDTQERRNPSEVKTSVEEQEETLCRADAEPALLVANLLVGADGTVRTVANCMERLDQERYQTFNPVQKLLARKPFHVKRYTDDNQRIYKTIPMKIPADWRCDLNYSARGKRATFDALPADNKGNYCGVLLLKNDDPLAKGDCDPKDVRDLLDESFPYFSSLIDDETVAAVAKKPVSYLPAFRYAGPRLFQGNNCVILGDSSHTVKPYFGLGANSALEDTRFLGRAIDQFRSDDDTAKLDMGKVVRKFSQQRAADSKSLVRISRDLDRPGKLGVVTFLIPIILDSIFSRLLPAVFTPNIINMMQREGWTFRGVARRKRFERVLQVGILSSGLSLLSWTAYRGARFALQKLFQPKVQPWAALSAALLTGAGVVYRNSKSADSRDKKDLPAVADVVSKFSKKSDESATDDE